MGRDRDSALGGHGLQRAVPPLSLHKARRDRPRGRVLPVCGHEAHNDQRRSCTCYRAPREETRSSSGHMPFVCSESIFSSGNVTAIPCCTPHPCMHSRWTALGTCLETTCDPAGPPGLPPQGRAHGEEGDRGRGVLAQPGRVPAWVPGRFRPRPSQDPSPSLAFPP